MASRRSSAEALVRVVQAQRPYTPCYLCAGVVRVGSLRFDVVEPPGSSAEAPYTPC